MFYVKHLANARARAGAFLPLWRAKIAHSGRPGGDFGRLGASERLFCAPKGAISGPFRAKSGAWRQRAGAPGAAWRRLLSGLRA